MTGGYHIINATGTAIKTTVGYSDYVIYDGTMKDIIDAIKNNKIIVIEGHKTTRGNGAANVETGAWVLNFVHDFLEGEEINVDNYQAVVEFASYRIVFELNWEEGDFTYAIENI